MAFLSFCRLIMRAPRIKVLFGMLALMQFTTRLPGAQSVDHFSWSPVPASVQMGQPFLVSIQARDNNNQLYSNYAGAVLLSCLTPTPSPTVLISEVETIANERVELSNLSSNAVDISGWRMIFYDPSSWPVPKGSFTVPAGTVCPGLGVFEVRDYGTYPGAYPIFYAGIGLTWNSSSFQNQDAVLLLDGSGSVIDFFCAVDAYPPLVTVPVSLGGNVWNGPPVAANLNSSRTYQRSGHADNNNAADWTTGTNNFGLRNPGLHLPLIAASASSPLVPSSVTFSNGTWTGYVAANVSGTNIFLRADDGVGNAGESSSLTVIALPGLAVQIPHQAFKATPGLVGTGSVTLAQPLSSNLLVTLSSSLTNHIQVPANVQINAGSVTAIFGLTNLDDGLIDGAQAVQIVAAAVGFMPTSDVITNYDRPPVSLSITLPSTVFEDANWVSSGQIRSSGPVATNVAVRLISSDTNRLQVPDFTILASGQNQVSFGFAVVDNSLIDGDEAITITASVPGWITGQAQMFLRDNENTNLQLVLPSQVSEGGGVLTNLGAVRIFGILQTNLTIALTSSAPSSLQVPSAVTILAGQSSAVFSLFVADDAVADTNQIVTVTASSPGFRPTSRPVTVIDNDISGFVLGALPLAEVATQPFQVTVTAVNRSGNVKAGYTGTPNLTAHGSSGTTTVSPAMVGPFTNGSWSGPVTITLPNRGVVLTVDDGAGRSGTSSAIDVVPDRILSLPAADLAFDALRNKLLVGVVSNSSSASQCIVAIDPNIGTLGTPIPLGGDPAKLAISDDFQYLYTGLEVNSTGGVVRVNLGLQAEDIRFPVGTLNQYGQVENFVEDMKVQPGHSHTLVATTKIKDAYNQYIAVYDDGIKRPNVVTPVYYVSTYHITFADSPSSFFVTKPNGLWINSINPNGAFFQQEIIGSQYGADMTFSAGNLFSVNGQVFNTNNFGLVGTFSASGPLIPDPAEGRVYFLTQTGANTAFQVFDLASFRALGSLNLPNVSGQAASFVRCGSNTFGFKTSGGQVHIFDTSFLNTNASADLSLSLQTMPSQPVLGSNFTYSLTVSNDGPSTSFGVSLTAQLPPGVSPVSISSTAGTYTYATGTVFCALGDLTNGAAALVNISVQPNAGGYLLSSFTTRALTFDRSITNNDITDVHNCVLGDSPAAVSQISLPANDIIFDPATQLIFASVPASSGLLSNCLVSLDPSSGLFGSPIFVGVQPTKLAVAPGGGDLYVGLDGDYAVRRIDTVSQTVYPPFSIGVNNIAIDLAVMPNAPQTVAVSRWVPSVATLADVALYDDGIPRPKIAHSPYIQFSPDGSILYGSGMNGPNGLNSSSDDFYVNQVVTNGLTSVSAVPLPFMGYSGIQVAGGSAYYAAGQVLDLASGILTGQVFKGIVYAPVVCVDAPSNRVFFVFNDSQKWVAQQFNLTSHSLEASLVLPTLLADPRDLIRWGTNGLAFRNDAGQLFLLQISLFNRVPQLVVNQTANPIIGTVGSNFDYTITVTNRGPTVATNVVLTDVLPGGSIFVNASSSQGSVTQSAGTVTYSLGTLSNGATALLHLVITPHVGGVNVNSNFITADLYDLSNGSQASAISNWVNLNPDNSLVSQLVLPGCSYLAYEPSNQIIFAAIYGNGVMSSNSIIGLDARTGAVQSQLFLGDLPGRLALSDDSHYLYVGLSSTGGVGRINLASQTVDLRFALGENDRFGLYGAGDLKVVPGQPDSLAVSINHGQSSEGVKIYDHGVSRSNSVPGREFAGPYWIGFGSSNSVLYSTLPFNFRTIAVDAGGAHLLSDVGGLVPGYDDFFEFEAGRMFFQTGRIIDPINQTIVGQLPVTGLVAPDSGTGRIYFVTTTGSAPFNYQLTLRAFDLNSSNELWSVPFPVASGSALQLLKCGTNGLAVLTDAGRLFIVPSLPLATQSADLSVSQSAPTLPTTGSSLTFVSTIRNVGPWSASGVVVSNPLPSNATFISASSSQGVCTLTNGSLLCLLGVLTNGGSATVTLTCSTLTSGPMTNVTSVSFSGTDSDLANNSTNVIISVASQPAVTIRDATAVQSITGNGRITFNLTLSAPSSAPVTVKYQTVDGSAVSGSNYDSAAGVVSFSSGVTSAVVNVNIRPNVTANPAPFFYLNLFSATNASLLRAQAIGTIITRNLRTLSLASVALLEGNSGATNAQFRLTLNSTSAVPVSVQYATIDGTATAGSDYQSRAGTVIIPPGVTNLSFLIPILGDTTWEPDETFSLLLSQPQNAILTANEGSAMIINDDPFPALTASAGGNGLVLSWIGGPYVLQAATNVFGPWLDLSTASSPFTNPTPSKPSEFYRLRIP
jgi:uncharacterized repeat protein (TIGR01451 family)